MEDFNWPLFAGLSVLLVMGLVGLIAKYRDERKHSDHS